MGTPVGLRRHSERMLVTRKNEIILTGYMRGSTPDTSGARIERLNQDGQTIWSRTLPGLMREFTISAAVDLPDGRFLFAGSKKPQVEDATGRLVMLLTDKNGHVVWSTAFDRFNGRYHRNRMFQAPDGEVFVAGNFMPAPPNDFRPSKRKNRQAVLLSFGSLEPKKVYTRHASLRGGALQQFRSRELSLGLKEEHFLDVSTVLHDAGYINRLGRAESRSVDRVGLRKWQKASGIYHATGYLTDIQMQELSAFAFSIRERNERENSRSQPRLPIQFVGQQHHSGSRA